jgi:hypothetical protein
MPGIHINKFAGTRHAVDARLLDNGEAQVAHNCLLTDGSLRPMPVWNNLTGFAGSLLPPNGSDLYDSVPGTFGLKFEGPPFGRTYVYVGTYGAVQPETYSSATGTATYVRGNLSKKAVNRVYGVTSVLVLAGVGYESAMTILNDPSPVTLMYEGDIVTLNVSGTGTYINIYRTTSDVTAAGGTNGAVVANWQLVDQVTGQSGQYIDAGSAVSNPMDTYIYRGQTKPPFIVQRMGLLESGFVWIISATGRIALADRFSFGYWPVENHYDLGAGTNTDIIVTGAVSVGDILYMGTQRGVFWAQLKVSDTGAPVLTILPILLAPPCLQNTMVATPSGAMYTNNNGVMLASGNEVRMMSRENASGVAGILDDGSTFEFSETTNAVYHNGKYYGIKALPVGGY